MIVWAGSNPRSNTREAREGPQQQPGANEQHDGQRHLRNHKRAAEPVMTAVRGAATGSLAERGLRIDTTGLPRRHQAERDGRQGRHADGEDEACPIDADRLGGAGGQRAAGQRNQALRGPPGHREPRRTAECRENQALDDELPDQAESRRAERSAERQLRAPPEAPRHQQSREVHAGNHEHHRDHRHQESKCGPSFHDQVIVQRGNEHAVALVERILARELRGDDCHLGARRIDRDARLQSSVALERTRPDRPRVGGIDRERYVRVRLHESKPQPRRRDPDHREVAVAELEPSSQDARVAAESPLPERVAQHGDGRTVWPGFRLGERAADGWRHAEGLEQAGGRLRDGDLLGALAPEQVGGNHLDQCQRLERLRARAPLEEVQRMHRDGRLRIRRLFPERDEATGIRIRQRTQQHRVDEAEDRGVCADAERQREHGDHREARALAKRAQGVSCVLERALDQADAARVPALLTALIEAAELTERREARVLGRHAGGEVDLDLTVEVIADFFVHFLFDAPAP